MIKHDSLKNLNSRVGSLLSNCIVMFHLKAQSQQIRKEILNAFNLHSTIARKCVSNSFGYTKKPETRLSKKPFDIQILTLVKPFYLTIGSPSTQSYYII